MNGKVVTGCFMGGEIEPGIFHGGDIEPGTFHESDEKDRLDQTADGEAPEEDADPGTTDEKSNVEAEDRRSPQDDGDKD